MTYADIWVGEFSETAEIEREVPNSGDVGIISKHSSEMDSMFFYSSARTLKYAKDFEESIINV